MKRGDTKQKRERWRSSRNKNGQFNLQLVKTGKSKACRSEKVVDNVDQDLNWKILGTFNRKEDKRMGMESE